MKIKSHYSDPAREFFRRLFRYIDVKVKIRKAKKLHDIHKVTYYVYKIHDRLHVLNDAHIDEMIKRKILGEHVKHARYRRRYSLFTTN